MTAYLVLFGGAFISFALVSGMAGPGLVDGPVRWVAASAAGLVWLAFAAIMNGLKMQRARPKLQALSDAVAQVVPSFEGRSLARAVGSDRPALVLFWSESDVASLRLSPLLADVLAVLKGRLTVGRVNVDRLPDLAAEHGVRQVPTLVIYAAGQEQTRFTGLVSPKRLRAALEPHL